MKRSSTLVPSPWVHVEQPNSTTQKLIELAKQAMPIESQPVLSVAYIIGMETRSGNAPRVLWRGTEPHKAWDYDVSAKVMFTVSKRKQEEQDNEFVQIPLIEEDPMEFEPGRVIVYGDGERAAILSVGECGTLHCHAMNSDAEFDLSMLDVERVTDRKINISIFEGPTCKRFATPLCDVCTPDDKEPGCYKDIPDEDRPCADCHGAPEVHNSCGCKWADEVRAEVAAARGHDEDPCVQCVKDQGPCGLGTKVCTWDKSKGDPPCKGFKVKSCADCIYETIYNCYVGRC